MAKITRGRRSGEAIRLHQASNDWVSADVGPAGARRAVILNPTSIGFESEEDREVVKHAGGHFWSLYEWSSDDKTALRKRRR